MSATGRSDVRHPDDYYATPNWAIRAILPHLPLSGQILEPCAGTGAIVRELVGHGVYHERIHAIEIDRERALHANAACLDYLAIDPCESYSLCITNPPYKLAMQFVQRALSHCDTVCMLLRQGFLASQGRREWLSKHVPDVYQLSARPSFTANGRSDAADYAWFVWTPGERPVGLLRYLDCGPAKTKPIGAGGDA